jgi:hypothetical protein
MPLWGGWISVHGKGSQHGVGVQAEMARALFWRLKANGHIMMGISSYQEFPGHIMNPYDDRHVTDQDIAVYLAMDGWLHCFRCLPLILNHNTPSCI